MAAEHRTQIACVEHQNAWIQLITRKRPRGAGSKGPQPALPAGSHRHVAAPRGHSPRSLRLALAASTQQHQTIGSHSSAQEGRNILVAVDGSQDSQFALDWTVRELYRPGDVLHVAHCLPQLALPSGVYAVPDGRIAMVNMDAVLANDEQFVAAETREVERMCERALLREGQVAHVVDILREDPLAGGDKGRMAEALCRKADELQAAAVVIASHAKSGLSEFLLGSVAAHCTTHCTRTVLVLHAPLPGQAQRQASKHHGLLDRIAGAAASVLAGQPHAAPVAAEDSEGGVAGGESAAVATAATAAPSVDTGCSCSLQRNIVVAVDDSDASDKACAWALENVYRPGDTFHLLRIIPTLPSRATYAGPVLDGIVFYVDPPTEAFQAAAEHYMHHRFEPRLQEAGVRYRVDIIQEPVDDSVSGVGQAICDRADELGAAAVVLGSHVSGGLLEFMLGSVATYVSHQCARPVAVLH